MTETLQSYQDFSPSSSPPASGVDLLTALVQLGLGGVSIGASVMQRPDALLGALSPDRGAQEASTGGMAPAAASASMTGRAIDGVVGVAAGTHGIMRKGFSRAWGINKRILNTAAMPIRVPMNALGVTDLARLPRDTVAARVQSTVGSLEETGRAEVQRSRQRAGSTLASTIDAIVDYLAQSPAVDALIELQIDKLLPLLAEHPAVERLIQVQVDKILPVLAESPAIQSLIMAQLDQILPELSDSADIQKLIEAQVDDFLPKLADNFAIQQLIRKQAGAYLLYLTQNSEQIQALIRQQGDIYIDYLNDHPDAVQNLVSGQSLSIAGQVMDEVRERTVTADTVAEMFARRILGRKARTEVEEPPEVVQRRASTAVLPSDFVQQKERADGTGK